MAKYTEEQKNEMVIQNSKATTAGHIAVANVLKSLNIMSTSEYVSRVEK